MAGEDTDDSDLSIIGLSNEQKEVIETVDMKCSLLCPIGLSRIDIPCKSYRCKHIRVCTE